MSKKNEQLEEILDHVVDKIEEHNLELQSLEYTTKLLIELTKRLNLMSLDIIELREEIKKLKGE